MKTYIALLRGINVSGQKKIKMVDLKLLLEDRGLTTVTTYIQSGNVVFQSEEKDVKILEEVIYNAILDYYGFEVPVVVILPNKLLRIYQNNLYLHRIEQGEIQENKMYFTLLADTPDPTAVNQLKTVDYSPEEFIITDEVVYLFAANGYGKTKLNNNFFEKKLSCSATTRNLKTIQKLLELSSLKW